MTLIRRTTPFGELLSVRQAMDRLFEDSLVRPRNGLRPDEHAPALDVRSTPHALEIEAALPGIRVEDVDISILGNTLTITASTRDEESSADKSYAYREIRRGSFSRTVRLPSGLMTDAAAATFENGMLHLSIPKAEDAKPRQIRIKATEATLEAPPPEVIEGSASESGSQQ